MFQFLQILVMAAIWYAAFGGAVWGLIDASRRSNDAFVNAGKQSKTLWVVILAVCTALLFVWLPFPFTRGGTDPIGFFTLIIIVAVIVYHVGVKPALGPHRRGPSGGSRSTRNTGGW
jgi:hypothetical protein